MPLTSELVPQITRAGVALKAEYTSALVHLRVERAVGLVGRTTMRFRDEGYALSAGNEFALGTAVVVKEPDGAVLFRGTVTGTTLELVSRGVPELVVVADDAAYKLARGTTIATYLNGTHGEVIRKMATRAGLGIQMQATTLTQEYLLQAGTDLAYLDVVCERLGYSWWVEPGAGTPVLHVKRLEVGEPSVTLDLETTLGEFTVRASGLRPTAVKVRGWDPDRQTDIEGAPPTRAAGTAPSFVASYTGTAPTSTLSAATATVTERTPLTKGEADALAGSYLDDWASAAVVARGTCDLDGAIKPGVTVRVAGAGPTSGDYLVTEVEHVYDRRAFTSRFTCGPRRPAGLVDTLGRRPADPGFSVAGLVVGVVTDIADPDAVGRVKVKYSGLSGEVESPWARTVTLGAGNARGAAFSPEVNDEVLVGFEHGDTRRPVVLGGLWSRKNTLPTGTKTVNNGKVDYRRITSRQNHVVEFADGAGPSAQHVLLQLGTKEHKIRLGADKLEIAVTNGTPVSITNGSATIEFTGSGDVKLEGMNVSIKANGTLTLEGQGGATMKSTGQASVEGTTAQLKGSATTSVEGTGQLALKGGMVMVN